jgi:FlaG/FlaF family flagellin (archaellin)
MVAITVILAAVIGTFVLGLGGNVSSAPQAQFSFGYEEEATQVTAGGDPEDLIRITHDGGDQIEAENIVVSIEGTDAFEGGSSPTYPNSGFVNNSGGATVAWADKIIAGDSVEIYENDDTSSTIDDGDEVRVIWEDPNSDTTNTIAKSEVGF